MKKENNYFSINDYNDFEEHTPVDELVEEEIEKAIEELE